MQTPSMSEDLAHQAAAVLIEAFGNHPGFRLAHAKEIEPQNERPS